MDVHLILQYGFWWYDITVQASYSEFVIALSSVCHQVLLRQGLSSSIVSCNSVITQFSVIRSDTLYLKLDKLHYRKNVLSVWTYEYFKLRPIRTQYSWNCPIRAPHSWNYPIRTSHSWNCPIWALHSWNCPISVMCWDKYSLVSHATV